MPSHYSADRRHLCCHLTYRVGCLSCKQHDVKREHDQAKKHTENAKKAVDALKGAIAALPDGDSNKRHGCMEEMLVLEVQYETSMVFTQSLGELADSIKAQIETICARNEPDVLARAFEDHAVECEELLATKWRNGATVDAEKDYPEFKKEDPSRRTTFKGLDRSSVPATPDYLVNEAVGLQVFLKLAKSRIPPHPNSAMGPYPGHAVMSFGSAIAMFGAPANPGEDWPSEKAPEKASEKTTEKMIEEAMAQVAITEAVLPEPKTEHEYRQQSLEPPTEPTLSEDDQWKLFSSGKYIAYTDLLVAQYAKLVKAKSRIEEVKTNKPSDESSTTVVATDALANSGGWPDVQGLDWAGFTNWVEGCRKADKKFGSTLRKWDSEISDRYKKRQPLHQWNLEKAKAEGFDDGSSKYPNPLEYYPLQKTIAEIDSRGLNYKKQPPLPRR